MASLARAVAVLGVVSLIGTATQVAKGKLGALLLGAAGVGALNQLTTLFNLLFMLAGLGFFSGILRQITLAVKMGGDSRARAQMNSMMLFLGATSLVVAVGGLLLSPLISDLLFADGGERAEYVALIILAVPIAVQQRIFRAYLNATRQLKAISRTQMTADISSVAVFAVCAWLFGLWGAIAAFIAMHAILLAGTVICTVRSGGGGLAMPRWRYFRWSEVTPNFAYGVNALLITIASSGAALLIGRMIITTYDLAQAGIFAVAFKVATVYLGALYAAAGNYYFPTLVATDGRAELEQEANRAVALYMTILPPVIIGLIAFGEIAIPVLFSQEFLPAVAVMAGLLLGDIFRVTSETMGLTLMARRRLVAYNLLHLFYAAGYIALAWLLLPHFGLLGIAYAYIAMRAFNLAAVLVTCRTVLEIRLTGEGLRPFVLAFLAVAAAATVEIMLDDMLLKIAYSTAIGLAWLALSWASPEFQRLKKQAINVLLKRLGSQ